MSRGRLERKFRFALNSRAFSRFLLTLSICLFFLAASLVASETAYMIWVSGLLPQPAWTLFTIASGILGGLCALAVFNAWMCEENWALFREELKDFESREAAGK